MFLAIFSALCAGKKNKLRRGFCVEFYFSSEGMLDAHRFIFRGGFKLVEKFQIHDKQIEWKTMPLCSQP